MSTENTEATPQTPSEAPATENATVENPEGVLKKNRELLSEIASLKDKVRAYETADEKRAREQLEKQGDFEALKKDLEARLSEAEGYKAKYEEGAKSMEAALRELAQGVDGDLADVIITHPAYSFDDKVKRIKGLQEKSKSGTPRTEGATTAVSTVTREQFDKMTALEKAQLPREALLKFKKG